MLRRPTTAGVFLWPDREKFFLSSGGSTPSFFSHLLCLSPDWKRNNEKETKSLKPRQKTILTLPVSVIPESDFNGEESLVGVVSSAYF